MPVVLKPMSTKNMVIDISYSDSQESDKSEDEFYYVERNKANKADANSRRGTEVSGQFSKTSKNSHAQRSILNMFNKKTKNDNNLSEKMLYEEIKED